MSKYNSIKQTLFIAPTTARVNEIQKEYHKKYKFLKVTTLQHLISELYEIYDYSSSKLDENLAPNLLFSLIEKSKSDYFKYLEPDSQSLKIIYDFFTKLNQNDKKIEDFNYSKEKQTALKELFAAYTKYLKEHRLVDSAGIYKIATKNIDKYLKQFDGIYVDSFNIQSINLCSSKQEKELLDKIKKNKLSSNIGRPRKKYDNTLYQNFSFNSYDEVRTAIKIAKKLMLSDKECSEEDIIIVTSDLNEYLPYFYNLLQEYAMKGYDTKGLPLNTFGSNLNSLKKHPNYKVQKGYWKYDESFLKMVEISTHLSLPLDKAKLQTTLLQNTMVRGDREGILFTDPNKFISLQTRYKHIIFIGSDITHFPPKSKDNFLYTQAQAQELFYSNNIFESSQTLYNELKRLSDNLYIVTATYKGKRKLAPSIILDKNIKNEFDINDIQSRNDIVKNSKRMEEDSLKTYQKSANSKEFTLFDGAILEEFTQGDKLSASALNTYNKCPMQYYFSNVLRLSEPKDEQDGFDAPQRGSLIHKCFEIFVKDIKNKGLKEEELTKKYLYPLMLDASKRAFEDKETTDTFSKDENGINTPNINHKIDLAVLQNGLEDIYSENKSELAKFVDYFCEHKFEGFKNSNPEELFMLDADFKVIDLSGKNEEEIENIGATARFVKGFIDRLDNLEKIVNIIDYKSSLTNYSQNDFLFDEDNKLKNFQLGIYMLYAQQKYPDKSYSAHLLSFKDPTPNSKISLDSEDAKKLFDDEYAKIMKNNIKNIQSEINSGKFNFDNRDEKTCEYCNFKHICHQSVLNKELANV